MGGPQQARYVRTIDPPTGRTGRDGARVWSLDDADEDEDDSPPPATKPEGFTRGFLKKLRIGGKDYGFRYHRPDQKNRQWQYLDDQNGQPGHLTRAKAEAARIAEAIAPGNAFLSTLLDVAAQHHDEGKRFPKCFARLQRQLGRWRLAYLEALLKAADARGSDNTTVTLEDEGDDT